MPIQLTKVQGADIIVEQYSNKPTVYLDNWAFNYFALKNKEFGKRITKIMNDKNGSIAFSIMNLVEVTARKDGEQVKRIVSFMDSMDGVLINVNPHDVIEREKVCQRGGTHNSPFVDYDLLKAYFSSYAYDSLEPFRISELVLKLCDDIGKQNYMLGQYFEKELYSIILKVRADDTKLVEARKRFCKKIKCRFPCTQQIYSKCIDFIALNKTMKMPDKEWRDVFHLIVPVAYCDFVLADKRWASLIKTFSLEKPCIAQVYSQPQIEEFLRALENYEIAKVD